MKLRRGELELFNRIICGTAEQPGETPDVIAVGYQPIGDNLQIKYEVIDPALPLGIPTSELIYSATVVGSDGEEIDSVFIDTDGFVLRVIGADKPNPVAEQVIREFFATWLVED